MSNNNKLTKDRFKELARINNSSPNQGKITLQEAPGKDRYIKPDDSPESRWPEREDFEEWLANYDPSEDDDLEELESGEEGCSSCGHEARRSKEKDLYERTSPEFAQDLTAYFGCMGKDTSKKNKKKEDKGIGTADTVDGPYTKVSKRQPFDDAKLRKDFLKRIKVESKMSESRYPDLASEYAEELNKKSRGPLKFVTDQEHWEESGVYSGEDLARYLAIEDHQNAYKEVYGFRPRHVDYDELSIKEIDEMTNELYEKRQESDLNIDFL